MLIRLLLLSSLLAAAPLWGQASEFPDPPDGHVRDTGERLPAEQRSRVENELARLRRHYGLDVLVVLWDRTLPPETTPDELAARIGETWAREDLWAVALHLPDSLQRPVLALGGPIADAISPEELQEALSNARGRGLKERTATSQVAALGLEIGSELVFLQNHRELERKEYVTNRDRQLRDVEARHQTMIFRATLATILALGAVAAVAILYLLRRQPTNLQFPQTHWQRRLGAEWCGGGHIVVSLPSRTP